MSKIDNNCHPQRSHGCGDDDFKSSKSDRTDRSDKASDNENVKFGEDTYDVGNEDGRSDLEEAIFNADTGADYDPDSNEVTVGKKTYDLDEDGGREAFRKDARDGKLDGKASNKDSRELNLDGDSYDLRTDAGRNKFETLIEDEYGATYDQRENKVTVEKENGDERTYDLDTEKGRRDFKKDYSDGNLDGRYDAETAKELKAQRRADREAAGTEDAANADKTDGQEAARRSARTGAHLNHVMYKGHDYNLKDPKEEENFRKALMKNPNVTYFAEDNLVMVGETAYDLDDPDQFHAFRQDLADRKLDGAAPDADYDMAAIERHRTRPA